MASLVSYINRNRFQIKSDLHRIVMKLNFSLTLLVVLAALAVAETLPAETTAAMKTAPSGIEIDTRATWMPDFIMGPFVRLSEGRLLAVDSEHCLISADEGKHWQEHALFKDASKFKVRPERAIIRTSKGVVILAFTNDREKHWTWNNKLHDAPGATLPTYSMRSLDGGLTWEAPQKLHDDWTGAVRDIIETKSGRVVFTTMKMLHHPGRHGVLTYCSDDQGQTWKASNLIDLGGEGTHGGVMEATIVELKDGKLLMLLRTNWMTFWRAESTDGGLTWHPLGPSDIPASSSPGLLKRLHDGRIVLIWNRPFSKDKATQQLRGGVGGLSATAANWSRSELSLAFSEDECLTWSQPVVIARKPGAWLAYPYLFEASPGELWITTMQGGVRLKLHEADFVN